MNPFSMIPFGDPSTSAQEFRQRYIDPWAEATAARIQDELMAEHGPIALTFHAIEDWRNRHSLAGHAGDCIRVTAATVGRITDECDCKGR